MSPLSARLIVVSNRLPLALKREDGKWRFEAGSGGLVTAMGPVLKNRGGIWIGWPGNREPIELPLLRQILGPVSEESGYRLLPVILDEGEVENYYEGFANAAIWPLFHDLQTECLFHPRHWEAYGKVNGRFARVAARHSDREDLIWVHDYHLMHLALKLKERAVERRTAFFLHIPFPPPDIFLKLPWRYEVMEGLTAYDFVAFQTMRDRQNFQACLRAFWPSSRVRGRGPVVTVGRDEGDIVVGALPISIDFAHFEALARSPKAVQTCEELRKAHRGRKIFLGVDRLDYTKGILQRLEAYGRLLEGQETLRESVVFIQILVPSREGVEAYSRLRDEIERAVSRINGRYATTGWTPLSFFFRSLPSDELAGFYRAADVAVVTPLRDGMNLVAKEYCACNTDGDGVLVLSEFAGAAGQLAKGALLVNPHDVEGLARTLVAACDMAREEREKRMIRLRRAVRRQDIFWWVDNFLRAAAGRALRDFPPDDLAPLLPRPRERPLA
ncbi:trehalose-6-phosphate synthase [Aminithiophilus ramosus]|uniref:Trehalose-6-phosphate synthase n=1 Tax=Aminithiophilus ramosus TaxID=3029084 RepID=A0A9Q7ANA1_9BACT|nr:trehalose-6-phosphate synthase [Aminithiophilus ramosus]QTX31997.1 trehalose-6-phosphate synthase [Aminithiophilus ramosus]